jgi:tetratricopeptide (TPR) repeat protein
LKAFFYYERGVDHFKRGEYDKVIIYTTKAIDIAPNYADAYLLRGTAYLLQDQNKKAIDDYN